MLRSHEENLKQNSFWMNQMVNYALYGEDQVSIYTETVNSITVADIQKLAQHVFNSGNCIEVGMTSPTDK
jgi:zinc protease